MCLHAALYSQARWCHPKHSVWCAMTVEFSFFQNYSQEYRTPATCMTCSTEWITIFTIFFNKTILLLFVLSVFHLCVFKAMSCLVGTFWLQVLVLWTLLLDAHCLHWVLGISVFPGSSSYQPCRRRIQGSDSLHA